MKSSSRSGRFKKKLINPLELQIEAPLIEAKMAPIFELLKKKSITDTEFTALTIITILSQRYPKLWLGAKRPSLGIEHQLQMKIEDIPLEFEENIRRRLAGVQNLGELINTFALKSTPETVNRSLLNWSTGKYPLELMFTIPDPLTVLEQQIQGRRCVSVLIKSGYILGERDHLSFTMHDLIHADHFYFHPETFEGQLGFYGLLHHCLKEDHFQELKDHKEFQWELDYFISDMNAYAVHLVKCLKSALIFYHSEAFFMSWIRRLMLTESEVKTLEVLNTSTYSAETSDAVILSWLSRYRQAPSN